MMGRALGQGAGSHAPDKHLQVQDRFQDHSRYDYGFDVAHPHPQQEGLHWIVVGYWVEVGGFVTNQIDAKTYVAAVRPMCANSDRAACWQIEKLSVCGRIVLNFGMPL